jgi:hypothetical protein
VDQRISPAGVSDVTRTRIEQTIFILLLITFAWLWMITHQTGPGALPREMLKKQQVTLATPESLPPSSPPRASSAAVSPTPTQELTLSRDPFQPPRGLLEKLRQQELAKTQKKPEGPPPLPGQESPLPALELQGILWGTPRPQAIINRQILSVGDSIDGVTLTSVTPEGITVSFQGQEFRMAMPQKSERKGR